MATSNTKAPAIFIDTISVTNGPQPDFEKLVEDTEGLHRIANTDKQDLVADVVFVHGLGGKSHSTWRHGKKGEPGHFFWPEELGKDLPQCGIWSIGYPAGFTGLGKPGMLIEQRGGNVAFKLVKAGLGSRPIIFVTHSMGGLVVKSLIVESQTLPDQDRKKIVQALKGIVFCGTPHRGSAMAKAAGKLEIYFSVVGAYLAGFLGWTIGGLIGRLFRTQAHVVEMEANAKPLDFLHDKFVEWQSNRQVNVDTYAENQPLSRVLFLMRTLDFGVVVPRASANTGIAKCVVHDVDDHHVSLVKPRDRTHDVYVGVLSFIEDALAPIGELKTKPRRTNTALAFSPLPPSFEFRADISRFIKYAPAELIGREAETAFLNDAWAKVQSHEVKRPHILTFVALGGEGKTSLVAKWAADLAYQNWPGCDAVFAWSFYSQGTREQHAASSDLFLSEALTFFGDAELAHSAAGVFDKGRRLAQLVGERRTLLILDGLEPLQYAPTSPTAGELKDQGLATLLKVLAANSHGLCVVTTRYAIPDLRAYWQTTAPMHDLPRLSTPAGVKLLRTIGVKGTQAEFGKLVEDADGHALTLQIFGQFLVRAFHGDIRRRDRVSLEKADAKIRGGHAFRAMEAYVKWLEDDSEEALREVAVLKLLGLFDRLATAELIDVLRQAPAIPGLTEPLVGLAEDDWEYSLTALRDAKLLTVNRAESSGELIALDAHPLLREYFARRVRQHQPETWRAAHRRLYEHLCATKPDKPEPTLEDLQPLYQAVAHGCQAGLQQRAFKEVYYARILRSQEFYSSKKLGLMGSNLGAVACFFEPPWICVSPALEEAVQAWLFNEASIYLRALGRLIEALDPIRESREMCVKQKRWNHAANYSCNLSELELTLGEVAGAEENAKQSVTYANHGGNATVWELARGLLADVLHQEGRRNEALTLFREVEAMRAKGQLDYQLCYLLTGFRYCDLLLTEVERVAWRMTNAECGMRNAELIEACSTVSERAAQTLNWAKDDGQSLLSIALDHLTLGRAALYVAILENSAIQNAQSEIDAAMSGFRRAGEQIWLSTGLLTRAWLRSLTGARVGPESAQSDLDEAWEIAERGPMRLHMADIHLYRARLFFREPSYPWKSPQDDLAAAEKLINDCGYHRRDEELADAKQAILGQALR